MPQGMQRGALGRGIGARGLVGCSDPGLEFIGAGEEQVDEVAVGGHAAVAQESHDAVHHVGQAVIGVSPKKPAVPLTL